LRQHRDGHLEVNIAPVTAGKSGVLGLDAGWKPVLVLKELVDFRHHVANYGGFILTEKPLEPCFLLVRKIVETEANQNHFTTILPQRGPLMDFKNTQ